jgi:hypothetical protein
VKTVYRFPLRLEPEQELLVSEGAVPLYLATQERAPGEICLWMLVDDELEEEVITVSMSGTGTPAPENASAETYLGSAQQHGFVWHFWLDSPYAGRHLGS